MRIEPQTKLIMQMIFWYGLAGFCAVTVSAVGAGLIYGDASSVLGWIVFLGGGIWLGHIALITGRRKVA